MSSCSDKLTFLKELLTKEIIRPLYCTGVLSTLRAGFSSENALFTIVVALYLLSKALESI